MGGTEKLDWRPVLLLWAVVAIAFIIRGMVTQATVPLFSDTDDAMRMVDVRDLLAGQNWFDSVQHRLNTPFGAEIHWSRLIDLPIAALTMLFSLVAPAQAGIAAAYAWPLLLLLILLYVSVRLTVTLVGREGLLPGLALPLFSSIVLAEFPPGRVDHHNVQIILTLALAWTTIEAWNRPYFAIGAGLLAGTSLAIGTEGLPQLVAAIMALGLFFVVDARHARAMRLFGLSFLSAAVIHLAIAAPPSRWLVAYCDVNSPVYVAAALGVALAFAILPLLPLRTPLARLTAGLVLGGAVLGAVIALFPACLAGPYAALGPWLQEQWMANVIEAKPVWLSIRDLPGYTLGVVIPAVIGLAAGLFRALRGHPATRPQWLTLCLFLAVALVVMLVQVRGARLAALLTVPPGAWLIGVARAHYLERRTLAGIAGLVLSWVAFAGIAIGLVVNLLMPLPVQSADAASASPQGGRSACFLPATFSDLAAMTPQRVMGPIDLGAHILLYTGHSVVAAPYHRNLDGITDALRFAIEPLEAARPMLAERGITLVVRCPSLPEDLGFAQSSADSFGALARRNQLPPWMEDVGTPGALLRIYAIRP